MKAKIFVFSLFLLQCILLTSAVFESKWRYECIPSDSVIGSRCQRFISNDGSKEGISLSRCQLTCGPDSRLLWPRPRESLLGPDVTTLDPSSITPAAFEFDPPVENVDIEMMVTSLAISRRDVLLADAGKRRKVDRSNAIKPLKVTISLIDVDSSVIRKDSDESYSFTVDNNVVMIKAETVFGALHAIETLFQMMAYDDVTEEFIVLQSATVNDFPEFRHRGILVDTSRNFVDIDVLKRIIDGMALSKLNVFHWHLTDSHSFPIELEKYPDTTGQMVNYGAYGRKEFYTIEQVRSIVQYANLNGVRVIPEFDAPSHVGYGWQFPGSEGFTVCVGREPWYDYCVQPPCGQLNPFAEGMYQILEEIYDEWQDIFGFDSFHMGGDEVSFKCWNSSEEVTGPMINNGSALEDEDFVRIWSSFQSQGLEKLKKVSPEDVEVILWTSTLTEEKYIHNLPKEDYTIQIWTDASNHDDKTIVTLAERGYKMIFSNYDSLYLDCGFENYVGLGNNWCSPYKSWRQIYGNDLYKILTDQGIALTDEVKAQVQGGEVAMWSEQVDSNLMEGLIFPRAAALAERLWTNPEEGYLQAESRMFLHRERLVRHGVRAMAITPTFCLQNQEACFGQGEDDEKTDDGDSGAHCKHPSIVFISVLVIITLLTKS